jgi:hypothetical protein
LLALERERKRRQKNVRGSGGGGVGEWITARVAELGLQMVL